MDLKNIDKTLFGKLTILYVEDDTNTRDEVSFFLKKMVGHLYIAENGKEGLDLFNVHQVDMVITDIQMPIMNGLDMVKEIRKLNKNVPVAVTTAFSDTDFLIKAIECGVDKYILKPIDIMEMSAVIQKCTNYYYMEQKIEEYDSYAQYILDHNTSFMYVACDKDPEYANTHLMDMFGTKTFQDICNKSLCFFDDDQQTHKDNWMEYVQEHQQNCFTVAFEGSDNKYTLIYKNFKELGKRVYSFKELTEHNCEEEKLVVA